MSAYCPEGDPEFMPEPQPQTVDISPSARIYNRALRALGVTRMKVERSVEGKLCTKSQEGAIDELVNAILLAHTKLIAAESNVGTLNRIRQAIAELPTHELEDSLDILEDIERVISSLEGIARAEQ